MIARAEISRSVTGVWQAFLGRPDADRYFDTSYAGFWRSFQVIAVIAPLYAIVFVSAYHAIQADEPAVAIAQADYFWLKAATVALDWVALPIVLALTARFLGISRTYAAFVVVRNWSALPVAALLAVIAGLDLVSAELAPLLGWIQLLTIAAAIRLMYVIARRFLEVDFTLAVAVVVFDFALSIFISAAINLAAGLPPLY